VADLSPTEAWAVGSVGAHTDHLSLGRRPLELVSRPTAGITAVSATDIWAFGSHETTTGMQSLLQPWDGTLGAPSLAPVPWAPTFSFGGVAPSPGNVWIVGADGSNGTLLLHSLPGQGKDLFLMSECYIRQWRRLALLRAVYFAVTSSLLPLC
jgi:hypothetical protein